MYKLDISDESRTGITIDQLTDAILILYEVFPEEKKTIKHLRHALDYFGGREAIRRLKKKAKKLKKKK